MLVSAKILKWFFFPPGIFSLLFFMWGIGLLRRAQKKTGVGLILMAVGLYLAATPLVGHWALGTLESGQKVTLYPKGDVIVLLTGGIQNGANTSQLTDVPGESGLQRILATVDLQKALNLPVVISGGLTLFDNRSLSLAYGELMILLGVSRENLIFENRSRNTLENARFTAQLCKNRGYRKPIVVTSGFHLRRALYCFEQAGLPAEGFPSGFSKRPGQGLTLSDFRPSGYGALQQALNEYAGMIGYRLLTLFD